MRRCVNTTVSLSAGGGITSLRHSKHRIEHPCKRNDDDYWKNLGCNYGEGIARDQKIDIRLCGRKKRQIDANKLHLLRGVALDSIMRTIHVILVITDMYLNSSLLVAKTSERFG